ncbi:MAG: anaerobic ribonucleoside-triphosphate reductase activating protein [Lachnospiraceae bacterium]|nr:anaerobic ribonucleoside-triphosphate reductase activating protein [Lachnospiraceae bacterium]
MKIHGFQKLTLLDYPEHLAATVFTGGCNFRCPFCHNSDLLCPGGDAPIVSEEEVFSHLKKRKGMLQGVCITGGEPTLQVDLADFVCKVKDLGYLVKLDTNGFRPDVVESLIEKNLLDYVAMDIKAAPENYALATGVPGIDIMPICRTVELLKQGNIPYEFRTTVVKGIHTTEEFETIGKWLEGSDAYYIQSYKHSENVLTPRVCGEYTRGELEQMASIMRRYVNRVLLRGIE